MKEEEAKTKWCSDRSLAINLATVSAAIRGNVDEMQRLHSEDQNCIASGCSKWKWDIKLNRELAGGGQPEDAENIGYEGYCGLIKEG